jgi:hypothetical protein
MRSWGVAIAGIAALGACSLPAADKQSDQIARGFYEELRTGADLTADPHLDAALKTPAATAALAQFRSQLPAQPATKVNNTGWNYASSLGEGSSAQLSHAYVYPDRTIDVQTVLRKAPGQTSWMIVGFEAEREGSALTPFQIGAPSKSASDSN